MPFNFNISQKGEITIVEIPKEASSEAFKELIRTLDRLETHLQSKEFRTTEHRDLNVETLACAIRIQTAAQNVFGTIKNKIAERKPEKAIVSIDILKQQIGLSSAFKSVEEVVNKLPSQLKNNTPITVDATGIKADNVGEDLTRSVTQNKFQVSFTGNGFVNPTKNKDLTSLDDIKAHSKDLIRNSFKACYGSDFNLQTYKSLLASINELPINISVNDIKEYQKLHPKSKLSDEQVRVIKTKELIRKRIETQKNIPLTKMQQHVYGTLASIETLINDQNDITMVSEKLKLFILVDLSKSPLPKDKATALVIFATISQEIKNNMSAPLTPLKLWVKDDEHVKKLPNLDIKQPQQTIDININDKGNIVIDRTITFAAPDINYTPKLTLEINPNTGNIENVDMRRELAIDPKADPIKSNTRALKIIEALKNIEDIHDVKLGVTLEGPSRKRRSVVRRSATKRSPSSTDTTHKTKTSTVHPNTHPISSADQKQ